MGKEQSEQLLSLEVLRTLDSVCLNTLISDPLPPKTINSQPLRKTREQIKEEAMVPILEALEAGHRTIQDMAEYISEQEDCTINAARKRISNHTTPEWRKEQGIGRKASRATTYTWEAIQAALPQAIATQDTIQNIISDVLKIIGAKSRSHIYNIILENTTKQERDDWLKTKKSSSYLWKIE